MKPLIEAITEYQEKKSLSDYQLAPILNISPSALWRIKNRERNPSVDTLRAIAHNIPSLKAYVANYVVNGDNPGPRRPGRPTWKETLEKAGVKPGDRVRCGNFEWEWQ